MIKHDNSLPVYKKESMCDQVICSFAFYYLIKDFISNWKCAPRKKLLREGSRREDHFFSLVVEVLPCSGCFINYMGVHCPAADLITRSLAPFPGCQGSVLMTSLLMRIQYLYD